MFLVATQNLPSFGILGTGKKLMGGPCLHTFLANFPKQRSCPGVLKFHSWTIWLLFSSAVDLWDLLFQTTSRRLMWICSLDLEFQAYFIISHLQSPKENCLRCRMTALHKKDFSVMVPFEHRRPECCLQSEWPDLGGVSAAFRPTWLFHTG